MKKILIPLIVNLLTMSLFSQAPQAFKYQAIIRDNTGQPVQNQSVGISLKLHKGSSTGTVEYSETQAATTNAFGLVNLNIGEGTVSSGNFTSIDWASGPYYIEIGVDPSGGTNYTSMGNSAVLSVPYALYAGKTSGLPNRGAWAAGIYNPGDYVSSASSLDSTKTSIWFLKSLSNYNSSIKPLYDQVNWTEISSTKTLSDLTGWKDSAGIVSSNKQVGIGTDSPYGMLTVQGNSSVTDTALFEVKDKNGNIVFAVFDEGVKIYVTPGAKGSRSGFSVGGRTGTKGLTDDIFSVTTDSVRVYINDSSLMKGSRGGFSVGGRHPGKGAAFDYLRVTPDSTRVYVNEPVNKGARGGFAVGGRNNSKGTSKDYFDISTSTAASVINPSEARMLWYPRKEALLSGRVLVESPDSVGTNSTATGFESKAIGNYSQAFGYQALAKGDYSTSIGYKSMADSANSFAFGQFAQARNKESYALGRGAIAQGFRSFAFGSAGIDTLGNTTGVAFAKGDYSFALGQGSQSIGFGSFALGLADTAKGDFSVSMGYLSRAVGLNSTAMGVASIAKGNYSTAMGYNTQATGWIACAMGYASIASGNGANALGNNVVASGVFSTALGDYTTAQGDVSTAMGFYSKAFGEASIAGGYRDTAKGYYSVAMGYSCSALDEGAVAMGNSNRAIGKYSNATNNTTRAIGNSSTATGIYTKAYGYFSFAMGNTTTTYNDNAVAMGYLTLASGIQSLAMGQSTTASNDDAFSFGLNTTASGVRSMAGGNATVASGANSTAMGNTTSALSAYETVIGAFNTTYTPVSTTGWNSADRLFVVANGTSTSARLNAFTILKNGYVGIGNITPTHLIHLSGGAYSDGATWTNASDRNLKENFVPVSGSKILELINQLPITEWNYKSDKSSVKHIGPVAQDFYSLFGVGSDDKSISSIDPSGIALAAIKELSSQNKALQEQIANQQKEIDELKSLIQKK